jgi:hypothetical protein
MGALGAGMKLQDYEREFYLYLFRQWYYFIRKRCCCVLPVQFRRSAGAFARARSGEG